MQREPLSTSNSRNQMNSSRPTKRGLSSNHPNTSSSGSSNITLSVQPTVPTLTPAQMYSNFEEWIKMCTDNVSLVFADNCLVLIDA